MLPDSQRRLVFYRILLAVAIGTAAGFLRTWLAYQTKSGAGDFYYAIRITRDLWNGRDPYDYPLRPDLISYSLPTGLIVAPFAILPDELASGVFIGLSSTLLAWCLLRKNRTWALGIFLSWPFAYALAFAQWTPLIVSLWFIPALMPLVLIKPQMALPLIVTNKIDRKGMLLTALILAASLIIYPKWPFVWLGQVKTYAGTSPLFSLPLGPLILLSLLKYKDRRAWLLLLMGIMPQRVVYDQLVLLLVATNGLEMLIQVLFSWITLPVLVASGGWTSMPINWQFWIILTLYIPALVILFRPSMQGAIQRVLNNISRE